jgi:hypothetical protein
MKNGVIKSFSTPQEAHEWSKKVLGKGNYSIIDSNTLKSIVSRSASSGNYHVMKAYAADLKDLQVATNNRNAGAEYSGRPGASSLKDPRNARSARAAQSTLATNEYGEVYPHSRVPVRGERDPLTGSRTKIPATTNLGTTNNEGLQVNTRAAGVVSRKDPSRVYEAANDVNRMGPAGNVDDVGVNPSSVTPSTDYHFVPLRGEIKSIVRAAIKGMKKSDRRESAASIDRRLEERARSMRREPINSNRNVKETLKRSLKKRPYSLTREEIDKLNMSTIDPNKFSEDDLIGPDDFNKSKIESAVKSVIREMKRSGALKGAINYENVGADETVAASTGSDGKKTVSGTQKNPLKARNERAGEYLQSKGALNKKK